MFKLVDTKTCVKNSHKPTRGLLLTDETQFISKDYGYRSDMK